jgi:methylated-DNA-[protein]-cysteine S-methyltransferase
MVYGHKREKENGMNVQVETSWRTILSPIGELRVVCRDEDLVAVHTGEQLREPVAATWRHDPGMAGPAITQLQEYFAGERRVFDLPIVLEGTPFQQTVWQALADITFGETIDYGELARRVGRPGAARAVGGANSRNPISIILPCHRVIGADGRLTGYAGGLEIKGALLAHERRVAGGERTLFNTAESVVK